jgi:hypothetical protein
LPHAVQRRYTDHALDHWLDADGIARC